MLPRGWEVRALGEIATVTSGGTPRRGNPEYWTNGTIPWIRTTEVQNCILNYEDAREFISEAGLKNSSAKLVPEGTILLAMIGQGKTRGQVALLKFKAATNQNCASIILNENTDPVFLFNLLLSQYETIRALSNSAGQSNLSGQLVKQIKVTLPPLAEQKQIARILSTWDRAIETAEKLIENSTAQKKALMQQLLTGERRLSGYKKRWHHIPLAGIANITMGSSPNSHAYNQNGVGLPLIQGNADIDNRVSRPRVFTAETTKECKAGDILFSVRAPVGAVSISRHHACIGRGIAAITAKSFSSTRYLYQLLLSLEPRWAKLSQGSTFDAINSVELKKLTVHVPSEKGEQETIARLLDLQDDNTSNLAAHLANLQREKQSLMQQLLTGKRRVKVNKLKGGGLTSETTAA